MAIAFLVGVWFGGMLMSAIGVTHLLLDDELPSLTVAILILVFWPYYMLRGLYHAAR